MSNDVVEQTLDEAFPEVDPMMAPYGARVLVQLRAVKEKVTSAGLYIPEETKETEKWNTMIGDRKSTRLNSSHVSESRMPSSA